MQAKRLGDIWCDVSYGLYLAAGALCPLVCKDKKCGRSMAQAAATLLVSTAVVQALKLVVPERRPDTGQKGSFPSGHSANTVALAAICGTQRPAQAGAWYLAAATISLSRIALRRHHLRDVVVGSLLGFAAARGVLARMK
jgi:membrane-associated phospholipid phosphatase